MQLTTATIKPVQLILAVALLGLSGITHAKDYLIEVIVFEHLNKKDSAMPGSLYYPKLASSMGLKTERAQNAGFELVTEGLSMMESAEKIQSSGRYRMLNHFAWRQPGLGRREAKAYVSTLARQLPCIYRKI